MFGEQNQSVMEKKFLSLCGAVVRECGVELYAVDYSEKQKMLRVTIWDKASKNASLQDCIKVDRALSEPFENADWVPEGVHLEVSSPGIYRQLRSKDHLLDAIGEKVVAVIKGPLDHGQNQKRWRGVLKEVGNEGVVIELDGEAITLCFDQIKKIQADPDLTMHKD